jgi:hypothetical protein
MVYKPIYKLINVEEHDYKILQVVYPLVDKDNLWKITIFNGKRTISMAIFNSYVSKTMP